MGRGKGGGVKLGGERNGRERRIQEDTVSEGSDPVLLVMGTSARAGATTGQARAP